jgi:hypothetical protein
MNRLPLYLCLFLLSLIAFAWSLSTILLSAKTSSDELARGRYLVEELARCSACHTPRGPSGDRKAETWLVGASIGIKPDAPARNWADPAPPLDGNLSFTDDQMEFVLEKGLRPNGETFRVPMHAYHLHREDARAIIAYLKSLTPAKR